MDLAGGGAMYGADAAEEGPHLHSLTKTCRGVLTVKFLIIPGSECNGITDVGWGPLEVIFDTSDDNTTVDKIVVDFSPKGGPSDMTGVRTHSHIRAHTHTHTPPTGIRMHVHAHTQTKTHKYIHTPMNRLKSLNH